MNELIGKKIIRWDSIRNGLDDIIMVILILDSGERVTFRVTGAFDSELDVKID